MGAALIYRTRACACVCVGGGPFPNMYTPVIQIIIFVHVAVYKTLVDSIHYRTDISVGFMKIPFKGTEMVRITCLLYISLVKTHKNVI